MKYAFSQCLLSIKMFKIAFEVQERIITFVLHIHVKSI